MIIKSIRQLKKITGKKVFLRADFNVPLKDGQSAQTGKIKDDYKIVASLPTIRYLLRHKCKIIIATHLGRPFQDKKLNTRLPSLGAKATGGQVKNKKYYSTEPIALRLSQLLDKKVRFVEDCVGLKVGTEIGEMEGGDILLLENLRFHKEELKNNKKFARELVYSTDIYINDAFGVSHRKQASLCAIKKFKPSFAGLLLEKEILSLNKVVKPKKPLVVIMGGVKIETKLPLLRKFRSTANKILIGGALANNFLSAKKYEIGKSLADKKSIRLAKRIYSEYGIIGKRKIIMPIDVVVGNKEDGSGNVNSKNINQVDKNDIILDIGPQTVRFFSEYIKEAKTIVWNGPMGKFEFENFKHGTLSIARAVASRSTGTAFGVVGGGETIEALKKTKMLDYVDWVSTGGGATLTYLGGGKMPGLKGIIK